MAVTVGDRLESAGGRPSGFDYMRIILSVGVVATHSFATSYGDTPEGYYLWTSSLAPVIRAILPMFFALSGFLVAGSLLRCRTLVTFLGLRILRIYPALAVEVILSALLLGPLVTSLPWNSYFSAPTFWRYLVNVTGHISFYLPGVFEYNPTPRIVNVQLWTVPFELWCYVIISALAAIGLRERRWIAPTTLILYCSIYIVYRLLSGKLLNVLDYQLTGPMLCAYFLAGVTAYLYREKLQFSRALMAAAAVLCCIFYNHVPFGEYLAIVPAAYLTACLGVCNPAKLRLMRYADYSYGVYLYGYVIQQALMYAVPSAREWYWNMLLSLPAAGMFAALSWHFVEKPALTLKRRLGPMEEHYLSIAGSLKSFATRRGVKMSWLRF